MMDTIMTQKNDLARLDAQLQRLHLHYIQEHYQDLADKASEHQLSPLDYLAQLIDGEAAIREQRSIERRIRNARFPVLKTLDDFQWNWPKKINRPQIQNLFRLAFIATNTNVIMIGNVGLGKTHLSIALGHTACQNGHSVLFTTAVDIINTLAAAQSAGRLKREFQRYLKPALLIIDELGYLPIDKLGADLLFQIISQRYERAPMVITTNRVYKHWSQIFNNDSTLTSAILDRVLHHADTVIIEGKSFRMKDEIDGQDTR
jgi:DNA replication protein DnaC